MTIKNQYTVEVDVKRIYTKDTPVFTKGDTNEVVFVILDDGKPFDIRNADKAYVGYKRFDGVIASTSCEFIKHNGNRVVKLEVPTSKMVKGYNSIVLTVCEGHSKVAIQPLNILIYENQSEQTQDNWQQLLDKIYKTDTSEVKLNHITNELKEFRKYVEDKLKAIDEKEEADSRTTQLDLQSRLLEEQQKVAELQNNVIKLQLQLFEDKRKGSVNMDTNKWITGSSTGVTIKDVLDKEFDTTKDIITSGTVDFIKATPIGLDKTININVNFPSEINKKGE